MTPVNYDDLANDMLSEGGEEIRTRVVAARKVQVERFTNDVVSIRQSSVVKIAQSRVTLKC